MKKPLSEADPSELDVGGDSQDELFGALADARRRFVLRYLGRVDGPVAVTELTSELVAWEVERPVADRSGDDRDAIGLSLLHVHLPKMDDAGLVSYDAGRRTVARADRTAEARSTLRAIALG